MSSETFRRMDRREWKGCRVANRAANTDLWVEPCSFDTDRGGRGSEGALSGAHIAAASDQGGAVTDRQRLLQRWRGRTVLQLARVVGDWPSHKCRKRIESSLPLGNDRGYRGLTLTDGSLGAGDVEPGAAAAAKQTTNLLQCLTLYVDDVASRCQRAVCRADGHVIAGHCCCHRDADLIPRRLDGLSVGACRFDRTADAAREVKWIGHTESGGIAPASDAEGNNAALLGVSDAGLDAGTHGLRGPCLADRRVGVLQICIGRAQIRICGKRLADIKVQPGIRVEPPPVIR